MQSRAALSVLHGNELSLACPTGSEGLEILELIYHTNSKACWVSMSSYTSILVLLHHISCISHVEANLKAIKSTFSSPVGSAVITPLAMRASECDCVTVVLLVSGLEKGHAPLTGGACNVVPSRLSLELCHAFDKRTTGLMDVLGATSDGKGSACRGYGKLDFQIRFVAWCDVAVNRLCSE